MSLRTFILTTFALCAFAANSILCRLAMLNEHTDAYSFTAVRVLSGAAFLYAYSAIALRKQIFGKGGSAISGAMLFLYAICFSLAYLRLSVGTGALILFGSVQITMISVSLAKGERQHLLEWSGLTIAFLGLTYLVLPGLQKPSLEGSALMAIAGIAWAIYSLRGRSVREPALATTANFLFAAPVAFLLMILASDNRQLSPMGMVYAVTSGALTSGLGYVIWYAALQTLTAMRAAIVQLCVPVLAGIAGVLILAESFSERLAIASALTLGGVAVATFGVEWLRRRDIS